MVRRIDHVGKFTFGHNSTIVCPICTICTSDRRKFHFEFWFQDGGQIFTETLQIQMLQSIVGSWGLSSQPIGV